MLRKLDNGIHAQTELFVTLLRADPAAGQWQYAPTVEYRPVEGD